MTDLVFARNGQALTTSAIIANGVGVEHRALRQLLRNYQADFESFGVLTFEMSKPKKPQGGRPETCAILNEQQATLLVTYCKNTETVRKFKVALVKAFYEMREQLHPQCPAQAQLPPPTLTEQQSYSIMSRVAMRAKRDGVKYQTIYRALKARYQVTKYTHIPRDKFEDALEFIRTMPLNVPEGIPQTHPEPVPESRPKIVVSPTFCENMRNFIFIWNYLHRDHLIRFLKLLKDLRSPYAEGLSDAIHSLNMDIIELSLADIGFPVKELDCYKYWAIKHAAK
ncbi:MAG TPA: Rha family transcriptional regulator [Candidatus Duodenibacillus intestinavium]|nr:Rha family transcriptional regulator [Candidatus Duodenibacillus intestinavium]